MELTHVAVYHRQCEFNGRSEHQYEFHLGSQGNFPESVPHSHVEKTPTTPFQLHEVIELSRPHAKQIAKIEHDNAEFLGTDRMPEGSPIVIGWISYKLAYLKHGRGKVALIRSHYPLDRYGIAFGEKLLRKARTPGTDLSRTVKRIPAGLATLDLRRRMRTSDVVDRVVAKQAGLPDETYDNEVLEGLDPQLELACMKHLKKQGITHVGWNETPSNTGEVDADDNPDDMLRMPKIPIDDCIAALQEANRSTPITSTMKPMRTEKARDTEPEQTQNKRGLLARLARWLRRGGK